MQVVPRLGRAVTLRDYLCDAVALAQCACVWCRLRFAVKGKCLAVRDDGSWMLGSMEEEGCLRGGRRWSDLGSK
jgi:hypothetical protein